MRLSAPIGDHHQHLFSPAAAALGLPGITAADVVRLVDTAGIRLAAVLSGAYMFGSPARTVVGEYDLVRNENDWTATQAGSYPDRLCAFASFNPLKAYAIEELERCAQKPERWSGIKLHFGNSDVRLDEPAHVDRLQRIFDAANAHRLAIVVHLRASISRSRPYGRAQAQVFVDELLPLVPDITVQVAHLAGAGPGYDDPSAHDAMSVLAETVEARDPRARPLWFDVATVAHPANSDVTEAIAVRRIRQVGVERILYGSDAPADGNLLPREGWAAFRRLPLTSEELDAIAANTAPYFARPR